MRCSRGFLILILTMLLLLGLASEATAAHFGYRPLVRGCRGEDVEELQWMLSRLGYPVGPVDGVFGPLLESVVKTLQKTYDLPQTGQLDGRMLEICHTLWSAFVSAEFEATEINPDHLSVEKGQPQLLIHSVQRGECLSSVARKYGSTISLLIKMNDITNPDLIKPGQELYVLTYQ